MDDQILNAKLEASRSGDKLARDWILSEGRAQLTCITGQICKKHLDWQNNDELSIALMALNEAIDTFNKDKDVPFWGYVKVIVRRRLIDYFRKESRHVQHQIAATTTDNCEAFNYIAGSWEQYINEQSQQDCRDEILYFNQKLQEFGLTFTDLVAATPKHRDTKQTLLEAAIKLTAAADLSAKLLKKKQVPIKELSMLTGISKKVLESGRRYVVAASLVLLDPELIYIRSLINKGLGEKVNRR